MVAEAVNAKGVATLRTVMLATLDGRVVCRHCEVADRTLARMKGLLGRSALEDGHGMLITPAPSVMTFFMRFPIDVVFLDRKREIVSVVHTLRPWRVAGARRAVSALELPAGTAEELRLQEGEVLTMEPGT
jgi:uncharacterized membrane protein (UPF0127 family)